MRVYPAYNIDENFDPEKTDWYKRAEAQKDVKDTKVFKTAIGPYIDEKGTKKKVLVVTRPLILDGKFVGAMSLEFLTTNVDEFITQIDFLSKGEAVLFNKEEKLISHPKSWKLDEKQVFTLANENVKQLMNGSSEVKPNVLVDQIQTGRNHIFQTLEKAPNLENIGKRVPNYATLMFFDNMGGVSKNSSWQYGLILYAVKEDADDVNIQLKDSMNKDFLLITIFTGVACILTLLIVFIVSFRISTKISKPLTRLMDFSKLVNQNVANKTLANKYFYGLDDDSTQIGELIKTYKKMIGISQDPSRRAFHKTGLNKEESDFPLN